MKFEIRITLSSVYPNCAPPCKSVAQLPGSMYPTATMSPGPAKASILRMTPPPPGTRIDRCTSGSDGASEVCHHPLGGGARSAVGVGREKGELVVTATYCCIGYIWDHRQQKKETSRVIAARVLVSPRTVFVRLAARGGVGCDAQQPAL